MQKVYLGGVGKTQVKKLLDQFQDPNVQIVMSSDMAAGPVLRKNPMSYYIGTCHTGAGGSLGALMAFLGRSHCHTFGRQTTTNTRQIIDLLKNGVQAFGLSVDQIDSMVPRLMEAIRVYSESGGEV